MFEGEVSLHIRYEYNKNYRERFPEKIRKLHREDNQRIRLKALDILGGKCVECGFDDKRALQIDHKAGNGNKERNNGLEVGKLYRAIVRGKVDLTKYQVLCANHNWIKRVIRNEQC
jgi:hypothetical protein